MSGFFEELKRRKVYRVAIAYVVASWALAQGLAQVLPVFDISNSVIRVVIALLLRQVREEIKKGKGAPQPRS